VAGRAGHSKDGWPRSLRGWQLFRFEITDEPSPGCEGERLLEHPGPGIFHAMTGVHRDILIPEDGSRSVLSGTVENGTQPGRRAASAPGHRVGRGARTLPIRRKSAPCGGCTTSASTAGPPRRAAVPAGGVASRVTASNVRSVDVQPRQAGHGQGRVR
jgi:Protein of unknown function (DUF3145)